MSKARIADTDKPELRRRLDEISGRSPEDTAFHRERVETLRAACPHTIKYIQHGGGDRSDCMVHTLEIPFTLINVVATFGCILDEFFMLALPRLLEQIPNPEGSDGVVVLYFKDGKATHIGRIKRNRVTSKWGKNPVYEHDIPEVPASYGDEYEFFKQPSPRYVTDKFIEFVRRHSRYVDIKDGFEDTLRSLAARGGQESFRDI